MRVTHIHQFLDSQLSMALLSNGYHITIVFGFSICIVCIVSVQQPGDELLPTMLHGSCMSYNIINSTMIMNFTYSSYSSS